MPRSTPRELIGILHFGPNLSGLGPVHFLRTKDGNHWLLKVERDRVRWLNGLEVVVNGHSMGTTVEVESIAQV